MKLKSLSIGRLKTENNVFLAPLAGYSDFAMRSVCLSLGAGLAITEMVSAKGLKYNSRATSELLETADNEKIKAVQLFGSDPAIMREACESKYLEKFDIVDVNMGCPVPKVFNNGEGAALLGNIPLAAKIVSECVKSGKIVTVKMRAGIKKGDASAAELARAVEGVGAAMITVHGRTREDYYGGEVNADLIAAIKSAAKIPVIANGGVFTARDAELLMDKTGADGVMLARGAMRTPELFAELTGGKKADKKAIIKKQLELLLEKFPQKTVALRIRKQLAFYLAGVRGGKAAKLKIFACESADDILEIIEGVDFQ